MSEERPITPEEISAAKRMMDAVNIHVHAILAEGTGRDRPGYVAIRLESGEPAESTNPLYDSRADATRHNRHNPAVCYIKISRETMPLREAISVLQLNRMAYKRGVIFTEEEVVLPQLLELAAPLIPRTFMGLNHPDFGRLN